MQTHDFSIIGQILDHNTAQGIPGLHVEIWDKDRYYDDFIGRAETDAEGYFEIDFNDSYFKEQNEQWPDLYFRLIKDNETINSETFDVTVTPPHGKQLTGKGNTIFWKLASGNTLVTIRLSLSALDQNFIIRGTILQTDGGPAVGVIVKAFDRDLRSEELLGETITDQSGHYNITYTADQFATAEKATADLVIQVLNDQDVTLTQSNIIFNARHKEQIDLNVDSGIQQLSQFEQLVIELTPLMNGLNFSELEESKEHQDISFLSGETGQDFQHISSLASAYQFEDQAYELIGDETGDLFSLTAPVFYGLFREGMPTDLHALLSQNQELIRRTLLKALAENIIPSEIEEKLDLILQQLQSLIPIVTVQIPVPIGSNTLPELLNTVIPDSNLQKAFITHYIDHEGTIEEFWMDLASQPGFEAKIEDLQLALQFSTLTGNYLPLVTELQRRKNQGEISTLSNLAALSLNDWSSMVESHGFPSDVPGKNETEQAQNYAQTLFRMIEDAFPTAVIAHKLSTDSEFTMPYKEEIGSFLLVTDDFSFGSTSIQDVFHDNPGALKQLKIMDRLFRIAPRFNRYEAIKVLMENGFNSAQSIAMMGQRNFSSRYAESLGNYRKAKAIYTQALQMTAMAMTMQAKYSQAFNQPGMYVLPEIAEKMQGIPDWESLFGSFELCDCEHCKSVYSPSAYLVDLLAFLREHNLVKHVSGPYNDVNSALGVLSERRRDIEHINLSCANANTLVPYVDLVNEILENAVPPYNQEYFQTMGTADELGANPEYLKVEAYNTLAQAVYPWSTPFNLWIEEQRTYLNHLGVSRYSLIETFRNKGNIPLPNDLALALASEYLGLTTKEQTIITESSLSEPWSYWGLHKENTIPDPSDPDNTIQVNWIELLNSVPVFLEKSQLTYEELIELLNTRFINPGRFEAEGNFLEIEITFEDAFCNTDTAIISNLQPEILNNIHRFVRLWRKLGWSIRELDLALNVLSSSAESVEINESVFIKLWHLQRIQNELKITIIPLLSFWDNIDVCNYKETVKSLYDQLFLNKTILNPEDQFFILNEQRNELINLNESITNHAESIQAALGIRAGDLSFILDYSELPNQLNIANLSQLFRIVIFSRTLKLSIPEFLSAKDLMAINPYNPDHMEATLLFIEKIQKIRSSGLSLPELEYLLRHVYQESEGIATLEDDIASVLSEIRNGVQKIADDNTLASALPDKLTAEKLSWLQWDEFLISVIISILNNNRDFSTDLEFLPVENGQAIQFPEELQSRIHFDGQNKELHYLGLMSQKEKDDLLTLSDNKSYTLAINNLFNNARLFIAQRLKAFVLPPFSVELDSMPPAALIPDELKEKVYYDGGCRKIFLIGWMTESEKQALKNPALAENINFCDTEENKAFCKAIDKLYNAPFTYKPEKENLFITKFDLSDLLNAPDVLTRFTIILGKLLPYIQHVQSSNFAIQKIADVFNLKLGTTERLLTYYVILPAEYKTGKKAIDILLSPNFTQSNTNITPVAKVFPDQFKIYTLLHKIALIINKLEVKVDDLPLLFQKNPAETWGVKGWADLNFLPLSEQTGDSELFESAEKLFDLFEFRNALLPGKPTLFELLDMAFHPEVFSLDDFLKSLSKRTGWKLEDLQKLVTWLGFERIDFEQIAPLTRLTACFNIMKRLGVSVENICDWITTPEESEEAMHSARNIKQAAKAKYNNERWLEVAKPLRDDLRDKQRFALLSYLMKNYTFRGRKFETSKDLYAHFLIDPEMAPCMMTSRLKLATSTVQLFIQRCLMNLEEWEIPDASIAQEWKAQWQWMKNYRVWEANRKVFLYPENWIEPELRDDKSPFFKNLENELLQNEVTDEHVEKAFLSYLEKLDAVANLEICGMYHEAETEGPNGIGVKAVDTLHVFGRTRGIPHIYYYRRRLAAAGKTMYWTPWEKVDLDIEGDHLIPVVWNRRLYLFWPIFTEKAKQGTNGSKQQQDVNQNEGQESNGTKHSVNPGDAHSSSGISYSLRNNIIEPSKYWEIQMAWSEYRNKKWSVKKITSESFIPESYSTESINNTFYGGNNWPIHLPKSEFAFKGVVNNSKLLIQCLIHEHKSIVVGQIKMGTYPLCNIEFKGCQGRILQSDISNNLEPLSFPSGMDAQAMELIEDKDRDDNNFFSINLCTEVLQETPGQFHILLPHQYYQFNSQDSFFFQDDQKKFLVTPHGVSHDICASGPSESTDIYAPESPETEWQFPDTVQIEDVENTQPGYYDLIQQEVYWEDLFSPTIELDPPIINETFPSSEYEETDLHSADIDYYSKGTEYRIRENIASLVKAESSAMMASTSFSSPVSGISYQFEGIYHPYVCDFVKQLNRDGIDGLFQRPIQLKSALLFVYDNENGLEENKLRNMFREKDHCLSEYATFRSIDSKKVVIIDRGVLYTAKKQEGKIKVYKGLFEDTYLPTDVVKKPYPVEDVDFESDGSYSLYNWEIFFHTPLMVADRLSKNQRFADAQKWFHYIFDPTDTSKYRVPQKYWKLRPFFEVAGEKPPETLADLLTKEKEELEKQVNAWRDNPFKPHLIARMRLMAYQKTVVMKYIDNLIAWGDQLFRRDSIESINEATQLYILAAEILGQRPENIPPHTEPPVKTFNDLKEDELDAFSNTMVETENYFSSPKSPFLMIRASDMQMFGPSFYQCCPAAQGEEEEDENEPLYFCIPRNQKLLSYWDTVGDRLFKIRHCMNIEGVARQLPLFEPPIDPALLVRAVAAGVDIGSALNDLNASLPHYRFQYMLQKAIEFCADVRSLGASLLSALEKQDAEELSLLRSGHEVQLLKTVRQIKKQQIDEAKETINGLEKSLEATTIKYNYFKNLKKMNDNERLHLNKLESSQIFQSIGQGYELAASIAHLIPDTTTSVTCAGVTYGGSNIGNAFHAYGSLYSFLASIESYHANKAAIQGGHERRWDEWKLQEKLAEKEIKQIEKQILAAEIRQSIAEKELDNHNIQIENAEEANTFMKDKFTNQELYNWMVSQISTLYFQSYQMAYDIAKRTEKTFRQELGDFDASFVKFGYWDNLKKGLLSGEQLHFDLKRMETAYLDKNNREYELSKHISLLQLDPLALIQLRTTGTCTVSLPEELFDMEGAGHYFRRIKNIALSLPCITGPYTAVNCKLTLLKSSIRCSATVSGSDDYPRADEDSRFIDYFGSMESIVASSSQNDSGLFETNLRDERYLPFENSGVISEWRIELPANPVNNEPQLFDYDSISDVILQLHYTARDGGSLLRDAAMGHLTSAINNGITAGMARLFSIRHEFPAQWQRFKTQTDADAPYRLNLNLRPEHFSYWIQNELNDLTHQAQIVLLAKETRELNALTVCYPQDNETELSKAPQLGGLWSATLDNVSIPIADNASFTPDFSSNSLDELWIMIILQTT